MFQILYYWLQESYKKATKKKKLQEKYKAYVMC